VSKQGQAKESNDIGIRYSHCSTASASQFSNVSALEEKQDADTTNMFTFQ